MNKAQRSKIKINGLQAQNTKLHEICTQQREAITKLSGQNRELGIAVDSILAAVAKKNGEKVQEDGVTIGYRIKIPVELVAEALKKYEVKSRKDDATQEYVIGVFAKEEKKK